MYNFTWKHLSLILSFMWTKRWLCIILLGLPSHFSSLLPCLNDITKKKAIETSHKVFWRKRSACRDGSLKNQSNYMEIKDTTTLSHHPYNLCHWMHAIEIQSGFCRIFATYCPHRHIISTYYITIFSLGTNFDFHIRKHYTFCFTCIHFSLCCKDTTKLLIRLKIL